MDATRSPNPNPNCACTGAAGPTAAAESAAEPAAESAAEPARECTLQSRRAAGDAAQPATLQPATLQPATLQQAALQPLQQGTPAVGGAGCRGAPLSPRSLASANRAPEIRCSLALTKPEIRSPAQDQISAAVAKPAPPLEAHAAAGTLAQAP